MAQKAGYKTTEFWASIPGAAALIELAGRLANPWVQGIAILGATVIVCWYAGMRTKVKR